MEGLGEIGNISMQQKSNSKAPDQLGEGRRPTTPWLETDIPGKEGWRGTVGFGLFLLPEVRVMDNNSRRLCSSEKKAAWEVAVVLVGGVVPSARGLMYLAFMEPVGLTRCC